MSPPLLAGVITRVLKTVYEEVHEAEKSTNASLHATSSLLSSDKRRVLVDLSDKTASATKLFSAPGFVLIQALIFENLLPSLYTVTGDYILFVQFWQGGGNRFSLRPPFFLAFVCLSRIFILPSRWRP